LNVYLQIHASRVARGKFHASFEQLVLDRRTGDVDKTYRAIWRSLYDRHITRWLRHFRLDQFHLVDGDKLVRDPVDELRKVEQFLGLEHQLGADKFYLNRTRGFYCMRSPQIHRLSSTTSIPDTIEEHDASGTNEATGGKCLSSSKGRPHPDIDPEVINKLRKFFRQHNERFYHLVGVDFGWPVT
jgi:[heparan sulfate]-glucosamine 3-sulfotransferase 5